MAVLAGLANDTGGYIGLRVTVLVAEHTRFPHIE